MGRSSRSRQWFRDTCPPQCFLCSSGALSQSQNSPRLPAQTSPGPTLLPAPNPKSAIHHSAPLPPLLLPSILECLRAGAAVPPPCRRAGRGKRGRIVPGPAERALQGGPSVTVAGRDPGSTRHTAATPAPSHAPALRDGGPRRRRAAKRRLRRRLRGTARGPARAQHRWRRQSGKGAAETSPGGIRARSPIAATAILAATAPPPAALRALAAARSAVPRCRRQLGAAAADCAAVPPSARPVGPGHPRPASNGMTTGDASAAARPQARPAPARGSREKPFKVKLRDTQSTRAGVRVASQWAAGG
jgi:hypothetical protein